MSAVLWLVSLTQVSLVIDNGLGHPSLWRGTTTLYSGWMGPIAWYFAWYANITFLIGLAYVAAGDNGRISRTLAAVSIRVHDITESGHALTLTVANAETREFIEAVLDLAAKPK